MKNFLWFFLGLGCLVAVVDSCRSGSGSRSHVSTAPNNNSAPVSAAPPVNHYQDMRNRGHSEEDAIIYSILKQQGHSDYESVRAMQSSKGR